MGGLGPGIGGFELIIVAIVALIVVGPKDLPLLMRKVGQFMGKARAMAAEFRASFDEMARQSELDELRKEVESLRSGQMLQQLGPEADTTIREIRDDLTRPATLAPERRPALETPEGAPSAEMAAVAPGPEAAPPAEPKPKPAAKPGARAAAARPRKTAPVSSAKRRRKPAASEGPGA